MMNSWDSYPADYRAAEVEVVLQAVKAGESVSLVGLSGAGKSNLLGFLAHQPPADPATPEVSFILVDCNRLPEPSPNAFFRLLGHSLGASDMAGEPLPTLEALINKRLQAGPGSLAVLVDRFDLLTNPPQPVVYNHLRVLRDHFKYQLTYVIATRRPLDPATELAELIYAHTIWLGPLNERDSRWNVERYAHRRGVHWERQVADWLYQVTWGYPSLLRAACEAYAEGCGLDHKCLVEHPAVRRRVAEFWSDSPDETSLRLSGLEGQPLLLAHRKPAFDSSQFTAKEKLLFDYFRENPDRICTKDELIQAVWPEDAVFEAGIRDDSLAQLVRRLRVKIEPDPSHPTFVHTVPGRGYRFHPL